ncbi:MAG: 2-oxo acid dehydrogenase subunit E2 [Acidimicrobiia bacterium]|nr:2-oxo acid dehydrogenase subunit E2 [Acidimicrobiia bacterium]
MPTPVVMPQMGESIAEGTIVRWIKKVGDRVDRDEPLFEISTDKVDAEIPSPAAGVLTDIAVHEGETVAVNSVVATIAQPGESAAAPAPATPETAGKGSKPNGHSQAPQAPKAPQAHRGFHGVPVPSIDDVRRQKSSPLVRRIARENNVDITQIPGSGIGGRVTKHDILGYIEKGTPEEAPRPAPAARPAPVGPAEAGPHDRPAPVFAYRQGARVEVQPLSVMRRKIAEHMVLSRRTSAHVHSVFHVNFSTLERLRQQKKAQYEALGAKLTYMGFIAKAVIDALHRHPVINASLDGDNVVFKKDVNLGIAVALESGLIVPVIRNADEKNLLGLCRAIADVAARARAKQLKPDDVHGGTFTITNPGQFGAQFGMPIINQPQVAILGVGTIEKRPVVVDDAIAIRTMAYLTLGYDHRLVDGAAADQFMSDVRQQLENFDSNQV